MADGDCEGASDGADTSVGEGTGAPKGIAGWLRLDAGAAGFSRRTKRIRFAKTCAVILIPSRAEYFNAGISLWYDRLALKAIQQSAGREVKAVMEDNPRLTTEAAMAHLYQPSLDVVYRNVRHWFAARPLHVLVVDKVRLHSLSLSSHVSSHAVLQPPLTSSTHHIRPPFPTSCGTGLRPLASDRRRPPGAYAAAQRPFLSMAPSPPPATAVMLFTHMIRRANRIGNGRAPSCRRPTRRYS